MPSLSVGASLDMLGAEGDIDDPEDGSAESEDGVELEEVANPCPLCPE